MAVFSAMVHSLNFESNEDSDGGDDRDEKWE